MKLLIVVDAQNDFIDGALGSKEAQEAVPKIVERIKESDGELILFTKDTHLPNYLHTLEGINLPVEHCIEDTEGWRIHRDIRHAWKNKKNTIYLNSDAYNGLEINNTVRKPTFGSVALLNVINELNKESKLTDRIDTIEFCGFYTDVCLISNLLMIKALLPEINIIVNSKLCAGSTPEKHKAALEVMRSCQINVK